MNPQDFRERALLATEPLQPGPASYEWLRDNVARRRRATRVLTAVAAAGCVAVAGVAFAALPGRTRVEPVGPAATPAPQPTASPTAGIDGDVDGDGTVDTLSVITRADSGRWSLRAELSARGTQFLRQPAELGGNDAAELLGSADADGDGYSEVFVQAGTTASSGFSLLATLVDGKLRWVTEDGAPALLEAGGDPAVAEHGWGCAYGSPQEPRHLYRTEVRAEAHRRLGSRTYYLLRDGVLLAEAGSSSFSWSEGEPTPPEYKPGISCESVAS